MNSFFSSLLIHKLKESQLSLRRRYITYSVALGVAVISIVLFIFNDIVSTKQSVHRELDAIQLKLNLLNTLQNNQIGIYRNIDLFLLDPSVGDHQDITNQLIAESIIATTEISRVVQTDQKDLFKHLEILKESLSNLKNSVLDLFESRMDIDRQFPGMSISANEMVPSQESIGSDLQLLIFEIENKEFEPASKELYPLLLKSYNLWANNISQMRIYLANRFAAFSNNLLTEQATSLYDLNNKFLSNISKLEEIYPGEDSFEGVQKIEEIKLNTIEWISHFRQVQEVSESDDWRTDSRIMKSDIMPQSNKVSLKITDIETSLLKQKDIIDEHLKSVSDTLSILIIFIIILFMIFIFTIIYSLDLMVFKPISSVAHALKSKAFNKASTPITAVKAKEISYLVEAFKVMDEKVNQRQTELEHQALHDHLTSLPNRFMLNQRLDYLLLTAERNHNNFCLLLMDLDRFKDVNDSLGHAIGDVLLVKVAQRLTEKVRKTDTVSRLGGDEFAILLPDTTCKEVEVLVKSIIKSITSPFNIDDQEINIGISIGIVSYPTDGTDSVSLMQHADMAMYIAKRNQIHSSRYNAEEDFYSSNRLNLISDLRNALADDSLDLYFQPQVTVDGTTITGAEALLRWKHIEHGYISPEKIVELAEYVGIIHQLSIWVIDKAIEQCSHWHQHNQNISIAINLSVHDLKNPTLCEQIEDLLTKYKLPSKYLTLEITESGMMDNPARSIEILNTLSGLGINLSIDDFGTGFSSLAYLKQLPVNELKIDKSFVLDMDTNESDAVIVQSTINLGHNLGLKVIAEGIEHEGLLEKVKALGCDMAQGYLFGKPQSSQQFFELLKKVNQPA